MKSQAALRLATHNSGYQSQNQEHLKGCAPLSKQAHVFYSQRVYPRLLSCVRNIFTKLVENVLRTFAPQRKLFQWLSFNTYGKQPYKQNECRRWLASLFWPQLDSRNTSAGRSDVLSQQHAQSESDARNDRKFALATTSPKTRIDYSGQQDCEE